MIEDQRRATQCWQRLTGSLRTICSRVLTAGVVAAVLYFVSFGPVLYVCIRASPSAAVSIRVFTFYRPLVQVIPRGTMETYATLTGLTKIEAFFLVQVLKSDVPLDARTVDLVD